MKNDLFQIGSVFELNNVKLIIIGYSIENFDGEMFPGYLCLRLPMGFINKESFVFVKQERVKHVIFEGYKDQSCERFLLYQEKFNNAYFVFGEGNTKKLQDFLEDKKNEEV